MRQNVRAGVGSDQARELLDRIHPLLAGRRSREIVMFGAVAVMADDAMAVAVHQDGGLLVRVDPADDARLLASPHASRAQIGAGRSMGEGGSGSKPRLWAPRRPCRAG